VDAGEVIPVTVDTNPADSPIDTPATAVDAGEVDAEEELTAELEGVNGVVDDIQQQVESLKKSVADPELVRDGEESSGVGDTGEESKRERKRSKRNSFTKRELVDVISLAAQARARRDSSAGSSTDSEGCGKRGKENEEDGRRREEEGRGRRGGRREEGRGNKGRREKEREEEEERGRRGGRREEGRGNKGRRKKEEEGREKGRRRGG
jgi:hypothetical protein